MAVVTIGDVRALEGMTVSYVDDASIVTAINSVEHTATEYIGSWLQPGQRTLTAVSNGSSLLELVTPGGWTVRNATSVDAIWPVITGSFLDPSGYVVAPRSLQSGSTYQITYTTSFNAADHPDLRQALALAAKQAVLDAASRIPQRSTRISNEFGQVEFLSTPGRGRCFGLPQVDSIINAYRLRP